MESPLAQTWLCPLQRISVAFVKSFAQVEALRPACPKEEILPPGNMHALRVASSVHQTPSVPCDYSCHSLTLECSPSSPMFQDLGDLCAHGGRSIFLDHLARYQPCFPKVPVTRPRHPRVCTLLGTTIVSQPPFPLSGSGLSEHRVCSFISLVIHSVHKHLP